MPQEWGGVTKLGDETDLITLSVSNELAEKKIINVFGVIKGFVDPGTMICSFNKRDVQRSAKQCTKKNVADMSHYSSCFF